MKANEMRDMTADDIRGLVHQRRKDIYELRSKLVTGTIPNANLIRAYRKDIARCLTLLTEREAAGGAK